MVVQPFFHQSIAWPYGDLAQLIRRECRPEKILQHQHIGIEAEGSIDSAYASPGNAVDEFAKQRHAFRLLGLLRDWPIHDRQPSIDQLVVCLDYSSQSTPHR